MSAAMRQALALVDRWRWPGTMVEGKCELWIDRIELATAIAEALASPPPDATAAKREAWNEGRGAAVGQCAPIYATARENDIAYNIATRIRSIPNPYEA